MGFISTTSPDLRAKRSGEIVSSVPLTRYCQLGLITKSGKWFFRACESVSFSGQRTVVSVGVVPEFSLTVTLMGLARAAVAIGEVSI